MKRHTGLLFTAAVLLLATSVSAQKATPARKFPGLPEPGKLQALEIAHGRAKQALLRGADDRLQLVVTGRHATGQLRDWTGKVQYQVQPAGVVQVDQTGLVTPLGNGKATITAVAPGGVTAQLQVTVQDYGTLLPVNFPNEVVPVFTKFGCNGGGCHGKASGQNGFKLSLLGFTPSEDYEYLVKEGRGRRLFPAAPDRSLLLLKAINAVPHGGGQRLTKESPEYRLLRRWIAQGMPYGSDKDPVVVRIEVFPKRRLLAPGSRQQLCVTAYYSDGSVRDVTRMAQYDSNNAEVAECSETGLVETQDLPGDAAVMARYQGHVAVFQASVPLGVKITRMPPVRNFIDEKVFAKLKESGIPPSPVCDDATFIRRVTIDIAGRLPTLEEVQQFLADKDPHKRDKLIDRLLDSPDYADYFANKWAAVLRIKREANVTVRSNYAFREWIRQSLLENKPYDQFVREIIAASGEVGQHPPVTWYRHVRQINEQVEDVAQLFLGLRIQCARCHHHPFEKWSQQDYYGMAAFFSRVGRKPGRFPNEERIFHRRGTASATNPKTGRPVPPTGLDAEPANVPPEQDPRHALVDWMTAPDNPFFARALANRYWKHFLGRGIVEPEDDMRVTNPPSNPELLDALAQYFVKSGYDLKALIRTICQSTTYQLSAIPNQYNKQDKQNYSRYYPKRLHAEVLLDAIDQLTGVKTRFGGLPQEVRAVQLPDSGVNNYFLTVFGRPQGDSACECERSSEANLAQSLHLLNSSEINSKITSGNSLARRLAADKRPDAEKVKELYLRAYARYPSQEELEVALQYIEKHKNQKHVAYEDILWTLINTKEFLFNH